MSLADELMKLEELRRQGVLSEEEFARAKEAVLSGQPPNAPQPAWPAPPTPYVMEDVGSRPPARETFGVGKRHAGVDLSEIDLPEEMRESVRRELRDGERLLWAGQPLPELFAKATIPAVLFGIPWTAFAIFWIAGASGLLFGG